MSARDTVVKAYKNRISRIVAGSDDEQIALFSNEGKLTRLAQLFQLNPFEKDVVGLLWCTAFDVELREQLSFSQGVNQPITSLLISRALSFPLCLRLSSESPLLRWQIINEHALLDGGAILSIDPHIVAWLEESVELDRLLVGLARIIPSSFELSSWQTQQLANQIKSGLQQGFSFNVHLLTDDYAAAQAFASATAKKLDLMLLELRSDEHADVSVATRLHRQAFLDGCIPFFFATDLAFNGAENYPVFPIQFSWGKSQARCKFYSTSQSNKKEIFIELNAPDAAERRFIWQTAMPEIAAWPKLQCDHLADLYQASLSDILTVAAQQPIDFLAASRAIRDLSRNDLDDLAQRLETKFTWNDLVLPQEVIERLAEIEFEARERVYVWAQADIARLWSQGRSLVALFSGPPGTGKTMAAQVIANALGLDLLRVNLAMVQSKWVGETAKNLDRILSASNQRNCVLFFDEADALFGKRTDEVHDAQDRYANQDISQLMLSLENYPGIVLLATNLRNNIDSAFIRRIRHQIEFPRPDVESRFGIWQRLMLPLFGTTIAAELNHDLRCIAELDASGAQIKNAALSALYASRRKRQSPDRAMLINLLARQVAKDGASLSPHAVQAALQGERG